jgi:Fe2+ transport system protein FeoA
MVLAEVSAGSSVQIIGLQGEEDLAQKLRQLGLAPGVIARVVRCAPFDGPFLIEVEGREIALGMSLVQRIQIREKPCDLP